MNPIDFEELKNEVVKTFKEIKDNAKDDILDYLDGKKDDIEKWTAAWINGKLTESQFKTLMLNEKNVVAAILWKNKLAAGLATEKKALDLAKKLLGVIFKYLISLI